MPSILLTPSPVLYWDSRFLGVASSPYLFFPRFLFFGFFFLAYIFFILFFTYISKVLKEFCIRDSNVSNKVSHALLVKFLLSQLLSIYEPLARNKTKGGDVYKLHRRLSGVRMRG